MMTRRFDPARFDSIFLSCSLTVGIAAAGVANAAVDPAQCAARFGTPGMVSYWTFDDATNPGADDVGSNHGTLVGGALHVTSGQAAGAGALRFSGGIDYLMLDYAAFRKSSADRFSVAAWFHPDDFNGAGGMNIAGVGAPCGPDTGTFGWTMLVDPVGSVLFSTGQFCVANNGSPVAPIPVNAWSHAVAVYDAGIILLYVDGVLQSVDSFVLGTTPAPSALIGAIGNNLGDPATRGFRGLIDDVAFFDRALDQNEVHELYADSAAGRNYCQSACSDLDGDGFGSPGSAACPRGDRVDCNDSEPMTFPAAPELCDGNDNDCDGVAPAAELDADRDGMSACAGDCDDADPRTFAGAAEIFDGRDNDCDGLSDEGLDDDHDGVQNSSDRCPGTTLGTVVRADGCPACGSRGGHRDDRSNRRGRDGDHDSDSGSDRGHDRDRGRGHGRDRDGDSDSGSDRDRGRSRGRGGDHDSGRRGRR